MHNGRKVRNRYREQGVNIVQSYFVIIKILNAIFVMIDVNLNCEFQVHI